MTEYIAPMNGGVLLSSFLGHKGRSGHNRVYSGWALAPFVSRSDKKTLPFMGAIQKHHATIPYRARKAGK